MTLIEQLRRALAFDDSEIKKNTYRDIYQFTDFRSGIEHECDRRRPIDEAVEKCVSVLEKEHQILEEEGAYLVEPGFEEPEHCQRFREIDEALAQLKAAIEKVDGGGE